ncbi:carboxypeptidase regulatory-like domain-containing protein [Dyadobacter sandarakinus]|uniref:Carboxypeptidase regulatory-like domain-containing protein n=2 Tax=Dyadobacter sandarakinus TaxID=2747268 RepID=A0ABX7IDJ5_9BACT|nr:carboxypeptidase regulatory-like domain-containing protein [Dyadobacter sandarakinus]
MFSLTLMVTSCTTSGIEPDETGAGGKAGYLIGKVTDQKGRGLAGATIFIENTVFKNRGSEVNSSSTGDYQLAMVSGLGQWTVRAYTLTEYHDRVYKMFLHPDNTESFTEEEKPVRNFEWRIQGRTANKSVDLYYGGSAEIYRDINSDIYDTENVAFTFQPVGPLIDGSTGKTLTLQGGKSGSNNHNRIDDIPIGRYKVTAIYKPSGDKLGVRDAWNESEYHDEITIDFMGMEASYRANEIGLGFTNQR